MDESVIKLMIRTDLPAPAKSSSELLYHAASTIKPTDAAELQRIELRKHCSSCPVTIVSNFDQKTGSVTHDWLTKNQRSYLKERKDKLLKNGGTSHFSYTHYPQNADYVIMWSQSVGSPPYTTYRPVTTTSNTSLNGMANTTGNDGYSSTLISGQASTTSTAYVPETQEWQFVDVIATVYGREGRKLFESTHRGNFRWSKPDKDCLEDAFKYLESLHR